MYKFDFFRILDQGIDSDSEIDWRKIRNRRTAQENKFRFQIVYKNG